MQLNLVNNTVQNDTIEIYNGTVFNKNFLIKTISNGSLDSDIQTFYVSKTDTLSIYMKASVGREYYGFIAEIISYPTSQYLSPDTFIELTDSEFHNNQQGAFGLVSAGERNPNVYMTRNRFMSNGHEVFNTTSKQIVDIQLQNVQKFQFGNNYVCDNYGGLTLNLFSGSGVLITRSYVFNNVFERNKNNTVLLCKSDTQLPYNELNVYRNLFIKNYTPRTDVVYITAIISQFVSNQLIQNTGTHILATFGFPNLTTTRNQEVANNLLRENEAMGLHNDLESVDRFRSTMLAGTIRQTYQSNYLFNLANDFELIALSDPLASAYGSFGTQINTINASHNYWSTSIDSEIRARIRDKYDNESLYEVSYSPPVLDEFQIRDGKCEVGWTLIDDVCYMYIGSYVMYRESEHTCKALRARLARQTVSLGRLQRFRQLARATQYNYESQSYRRLWLHTENPTAGSCVVLDDYVTTSILYAACDEQLNTFICEKDPVFYGAQFRFKDEIAFAIGAIGLLGLCVGFLCLLWLCKSRSRKREHMERKETLRRSARANRHILNDYSFSNAAATPIKPRDDSERSIGGGASGGAMLNRYVTTNKAAALKTPSISTTDSGGNQRGTKRIVTNRFKKAVNKRVDDNDDDTENDYHIYDMNVDEDAYGTTTSAHSTLGRNNNRKPFLYNSDNSPTTTKMSVDTTDTYDDTTDTMGRLNSRIGADTALIGKHTGRAMAGPTQLISPGGRSSNTYQSTPGILKKSNVFSSSYEHLANTISDDTANEQSSGDYNYNIMMQPDVIELMAKHDNRTALTTFRQEPTKSTSNLTNITQLIDSSNGIIGQRPSTRPQLPLRPPPPIRPVIMAQHEQSTNAAVNCESPQSLLIAAVSSPNIRSVPKYTLAAESAIAGINNFKRKNDTARMIEQFNKHSNSTIVNNGSSSSSGSTSGAGGGVSSSYTMKKPPILAEINNKFPLRLNNHNYPDNQTNNETYMHSSTVDMSKPPPMESEI
jgi:hypothetical protein